MSAPIQRTEADWEAVCAQNGRLYGDLVTWQRVAREALAEAASLREQVARLSDELHTHDQEGA